MPRAATGPIPRTPTGPFPRAATGPFPRAAGGQFPGDAGEPWTGSAPGPWPGRETGPLPQAFADSPLPPDFGNWTSPDVRAQSLGSGNWERQGWDDYPPEPAWPRTATGPMQQAEDAMPPWALPGAFGGHPAYGAAPGSLRDASWYPAEPSWEGGLPEPDPGLKYREPGPGMPGYRGSRDHRYGGDRY
jgi:hypothetical protein